MTRSDDRGPAREMDPREFDALLRLHRTLDLDELLQGLADQVAEWVVSPCAAIYLQGGRDGHWLPRIWTVPEDDPLRRTLGPLHGTRPEDIVGPDVERTFEGAGPFAPDASGEDRTPPERTVALAVRGAEDEAVAMLVVVDPRHPDPDRLKRVLHAIRPAVANAIRVAAMKELVIKDDTAACYNRRHFEESLPEELSRSQRYRSAVSLIFFDLDNLKQVNSRHGHAMGSRTLYEVSVRVRSKIRKFDKLFRFGGDEFCILLPETEWHGALEVAERVREAIAGSNFLSGLLADPDGVRVTASFGIASYPLHARTKEDIIVQADRAMQRIKNGTKNSIAIAEIVGEGHES